MQEEFTDFPDIFWVFNAAVRLNREHRNSSLVETPFLYDVMTVDQLQSLSHQNGLVGEWPTCSGLAHPVADFDQDLKNALSRLAIKKCEFRVLVRIRVVPVEARIVQGLERAVRAVTDDDNKCRRVGEPAARFFQEVVQPGVVDLATDQFLVGRVRVLGKTHQALDFLSDVVFREHHNCDVAPSKKVNEAVAQSSFAYSTDTSKNKMKKNHFIVLKLKKFLLNIEFS